MNQNECIISTSQKRRYFHKINGEYVLIQRKVEKNNAKNTFIS